MSRQPLKNNTTEVEPIKQEEEESGQHEEQNANVLQQVMTLVHNVLINLDICTFYYSCNKSKSLMFVDSARKLCHLRQRYRTNYPLN